MADQTPQSTGLFTASDYILTSIDIITSTGDAVSIRPIMLELNIYEDVFSPVMTGDVTVGDAGDVLSSHQLQGNEFIAIAVDKPGLDRPIKKVFRIYKISNRSFNTASMQNYTIHFCSEELILSTQTLISKSYKGLTIDTMVKDILNNKLKVNPNKMANGIFSPSRGSFDIIIPKMQPLEAIQWLSPRAYNNKENLFFFFENRDGFNFTSYEHLINLPVYASYTRSVKTTPEPDKNMYSINDITIIEDFDIVKANRMGAYSSTLAVLDLVNRTFRAYNFNATKVDDSGLVNKNIPINGLKNRLGFDAYSSTESMLKYVASSDGDPTFNSADLKNWLPQTAARLGQIHTFKAVMAVPGDVMLKAGALIHVTIPKMVVQDGKDQDDAMRTGDYFVSSVHHIFQQDIFTSVIEILSDSVNTDLKPAVQSSETVTAMIKA